MLTLKQAVDGFLDRLSELDYALSTLRGYEVAVAQALGKWLFLSSDWSMFGTASIASHKLDQQQIEELKKFFKWAAKHPHTNFKQALDLYKQRLLQSGHSTSWVQDWYLLVLNHGSSAMYNQPLDSLQFLLSRIVTEEVKISSKKDTRKIIRFINYLHTHGLLKVNLSWQEKEKWEKQIETLLEQAAQVLLSFNSSTEDLLLAYLHYCHTEKELTLSSIKHEYRYLRCFFDWVEDFTLDKLTASLIKSYITSLKKRGLAWTSVRHHFNTIRYWSRFLVEYELIAKDPTQDMVLKKNERPDKNTLTLKERDLLLEAPLAILKKEEINKRRAFVVIRDLCILHLFVTTGIRRAEIGNLKLVDLNLKDRSLRVRGKGSRRYLDKPRTLFLDDVATLQNLETYLELRKDMSCPWLFITFAGFKLKPTSFLHVVRKYGQRAGIERPVHPNLLRSSFASWMVEGGIDPVALKELMGHTSIRTTFGYYVHLKEDFIRDTWSRYNPLSRILEKSDSHE